MGCCLSVLRFYLFGEVLTKIVQNIIDTYPVKVSKKIKFLRNLIYEVAKKDKRIGCLTETVRWGGQPSYVTKESGSGSLIRLGIIKN